MNKIIILDGNNIQFRSIFNFIGQYNREKIKICANMTNQKFSKIEEYSQEVQDKAEQILDGKLRRHELFIGAPTWTFMNMLTGYYNILNVDLEDSIILALDFGSWRKALDSRYKSQREGFRLKFKSAEWWKEQYSHFNDLYNKINESMPIYIIKVFMREADDVISCVARYNPNKEVIIISSDKDLEMLAKFPNVKIFSPITRKFKEIPNPVGVLMEKIQGDISDNLLDKPSSEAEWERRRKIVDLTQLPIEIEQPIKEELNKIMPKNLNLARVPFPSIRKKLAKIYKLE